MKEIRSFDVLANPRVSYFTGIRDLALELYPFCVYDLNKQIIASTYHWETRSKYVTEEVLHYLPLITLRHYENRVTKHN